MDPIARYRRAAAITRDVVASVPDEAWSAPTPCTEWTVRDLVNHLTSECLWMPDLLAGSTIEEVGDRFDGDVVGHAPRDAFLRADDAASRAVEGLDDVGRIVHLSFGDVPAAVYLSQLATDRVVHAWDVAVACGRDVEVDDDLAQSVLDDNRAMITDDVRATGIIGPEVAVADDAPTFHRLLGFLGRDPAWAPVG